MKLKVLLTLVFLFSISLCYGQLFASSIVEANKILSEGKELYDHYEYEKALEKYEKALQIFKENDCKDGILECLESVGNIYKERYEYKKALEYYTLALEMSEGDIKFKEIEADNLNNIGIVYYYLDNYEKALEYWHKGLNFSKKSYYKKGEGKSLRCIANYYLTFGEYKIAFKLYNQALSICRDILDREGEVAILNDLGILYYFKCDYVSAFEYLNKAIELDPQMVDTWINKGIFLTKIDDEEKAIECYNKAIELAPKCTFAWCDKGNALYYFRRYEEALQCYNKVTELDPKNVDAWTNKGQILTINERYDEAIECYDKAIGLWINIVTALANLEKYKRATECFIKAIECYDKAIEADPKEVDAWTNKGRILYYLKRYEEALQCYDKAIELNPKQVDVWTNKGTVLYYLKRYEEALQCYDKAIESDPKEVDAWINKGITFAIIERYDEAIECYDKVIELAPKEVDAWINKGSTFAIIERYDEAIECYDKAIELAPKRVDAWVNRGSVFAIIERYDEAIECYDKAIELEANYVDAWVNKGNVLAVIGNNADAIECYDKAIELAPNYVDAWTNKAVILTSLKRYEEALECYDKAIDLDSQNINILLNKANMCYISNRYKVLLECCDKILKLDHEQIGAWNGKGFALRALGEYEKATECYKKILEIESKTINYDVKSDFFYCNKKDLILYEYKSWEKALEYYDKALEVNPENIIIWGNRGLILQELRRYDEALVCYDKVIENGNTSDKKYLAALENKAIIYMNFGMYLEAYHLVMEALQINKNMKNKEGEISDLVLLEEIAYFSNYTIYDDDNPLVDDSALWDYWGSFFGNICNMPKQNHILWLFLSMLEINKFKGASEVFNMLYKTDVNSMIYKMFCSLKDNNYLGLYYLSEKEYGTAKKLFLLDLQVKEFQSDEDLFLDYTALGIIEERMGNYGKAVDYYLKSVELAEESRDLIGAQDLKEKYFEAKIIYFERFVPYEGLVRVYSYLNKEEDAFKYSEKLKARVLLEAIAGKYDYKGYKIAKKDLKEEQEINSNISNTNELLEEAGENCQKEEIKLLEQEIKGLNEEKKLFVDRLYDNYPEYASIKYPRPLEIKDLHLNPGEVLIEYEITEEETFIFIVREQNIECIVKDGLTREKLSELVANYLLTFDLENLEKYDPSRGKKLYDLLLKDVNLKADEKVIIIPDEILGILPFEALVTEIPTDFKMESNGEIFIPHGVKYVADEPYSITYCQSGSALSIMRTLGNKEQGKDGLFGIADPVFTEDDSRVKLYEITDKTKDILREKLSSEKVEREFSGREFLEIELIKKLSTEGFIEQEINDILMSCNELERIDISTNISNLTPGREDQRLPLTGILAKNIIENKYILGNIEILTGLEATESAIRIKEKDLCDYKYILFATHGTLESGPGREPALVLCPIEKFDRWFELTEGLMKKLEEKVDVYRLQSLEYRYYNENELTEKLTDLKFSPEEIKTILSYSNVQINGYLEMREVMDMRLGAETVILSACDTGLSAKIDQGVDFTKVFTLGEGVSSMGRAFQYAGAKNVLISLWSVETESTNLMIEEYFRNLEENSNIESLREARDYIREEGYDHPYFWAPFILVGE